MQEPFTPSFFRSLQQLKIRTRKAVLGTRQGSHRSIRRGHGLEFADYRLYAPGDDFRHIDWGVYGRTDRLYVREFREERDLNVVVLLDASASMAHPLGEHKFDFARNLALALGYIGLADGDTVTFGILGQELSPRYSGPKALSRAFTLLNKITPAGQFNLIDEVRAALAQTKLPGKCFFISDFLEDPQAIKPALDFIRAKNFDLSLLQVLSPSELSPKFEGEVSLIVDAESSEELDLPLDPSLALDYAKALSDHVAMLEQYAQHAGIVHALISSGDNLSDTVLRRLPELRLLQ